MKFVLMIYNFNSYPENPCLVTNYKGRREETSLVNSLENYRTNF